MGDKGQSKVFGRGEWSLRNAKWPRPLAGLHAIFAQPANQQPWGSCPFLGIVQKGRAAPGMQSHFLHMGWVTPQCILSPLHWAHPDVTEMRLASQG